jgi:hypothetical protein
MAYDVSALPNYTEQGEKVIYNKLFTNSPILDAIKNNSNLMTGVKSAQTINVITTEGVWQAQGCARNPSGSTTLSQRTVTVGKPKIDLSFCERDLEPKFTQKALVKGSDYESLTYNTEIAEDALQKIANRMRTAVWKGDTASVDQYLKHFNGLNKTLIADVAAGNIYSGTAWNEGNSRTVIKGLAALVVADTSVYVAGETNLKAYMSPAMAFAYRSKLIADNLYHIDPTNPKQPLYLEGTTIPVVEDAGLAGTNYIWVIEDENLHGATDLENEEDKIEMHYSKDDKVIYLNVEWKFGVNVAFPERVYGYLGV